MIFLFIWGRASLLGTKDSAGTYIYVGIYNNIIDISWIEGEY